MTQFVANRLVKLSPLLLAIPLVLWSCSDDDNDAPNEDGAAGEGGTGASGGSSAGDSSTSAGSPPVAPLICGLQTELSQCNPVTATGCDVTAGETCDHSAMLSGFKCFPESEVPAGEFCDNTTVFCGAKTFCNTELSVCQHYCCDESDCAEGACERGYFVDGAADVGLCFDEYGGRCFYATGGAASDCEAGGAGGSGGQGGGGAGGGSGGQGGSAGEGGSPLP